MTKTQNPSSENEEGHDAVVESDPSLDESNDSEGSEGVFRDNRALSRRRVLQGTAAAGATAVAGPSLMSQNAEAVLPIAVGGAYGAAKLGVGVAVHAGLLASAWSQVQIEETQFNTEDTLHASLYASALEGNYQYYSRIQEAKDSTELTLGAAYAQAKIQAVQEIANGNQSQSDIFAKVDEEILEFYSKPIENLNYMLDAMVRQIQWFADEHTRIMGSGDGNLEGMIGGKYNHIIRDSTRDFYEVEVTLPNGDTMDVLQMEAQYGSSNDSEPVAPYIHYNDESEIETLENSEDVLFTILDEQEVEHTEVWDEAETREYAQKTMDTMNTVRSNLNELVGDVVNEIDPEDAEELIDAGLINSTDRIYAAANEWVESGGSGWLSMLRTEMGVEQTPLPSAVTVKQIFDEEEFTGQLWSTNAEAVFGSTIEVGDEYELSSQPDEPDTVSILNFPDEHLWEDDAGTYNDDFTEVEQEGALLSLGNTNWQTDYFDPGEGFVQVEIDTESVSDGATAELEYYDFDAEEFITVDSVDLLENGMNTLSGDVDGIDATNWLVNVSGDDNDNRTELTRLRVDVEDYDTVDIPTFIDYIDDEGDMTTHRLETFEVLSITDKDGEEVQSMDVWSPELSTTDTSNLATRLETHSERRDAEDEETDGGAGGGGSGGSYQSIIAILLGLLGLGWLMNQD